MRCWTATSRRWLTARYRCRTYISRPIAAVVLQPRAAMLRTITKESVLDVLAALDFLQPIEKDAMLDAIGAKIRLNGWQQDQGICRNLLKMALARPLVRSLLMQCPELMDCCAPYIAKSGQQVASHWSAGASDAGDGSLRNFIISALCSLTSVIDRGTCGVRLETLQQFLIETTMTGNFNEAAAAVFQTEQLAQKCVIDMADLELEYEHAPFATDMTGTKSADSAQCIGRYYDDDPDDYGDMLLEDVKTFKIFTRCAAAVDGRPHGVFCYSSRATISVDGVEETLENPYFSVGMLTGREDKGLTVWCPFRSQKRFADTGKKVKDVKATVTISHHPMRCLVLHCLRIMLLERRSADIQAVGYSMDRQAAESVGALLSRIRAGGVSPLWAVTAWFARRDRQEVLGGWCYGEILSGCVSLDVFLAHSTDIAAFIRTVTTLGDRQRLFRLVWGMVGGPLSDGNGVGKRAASEVNRRGSDLMQAILGSIADGDELDSAASGPSRKRPKVEL